MSELVEFVPGPGRSMRLAAHQAAKEGKHLVIGNPSTPAVGNAHPAASAAPAMRLAEAASTVTAVAAVAHKAGAVATLTQTDIAIARQCAYDAERDRWAAVFASERSHGRERECVALLSGTRRLSADDVIAKLSGGKSQAAKLDPTRTAEITAIWERAYTQDRGQDATDTSLADQPKAADSADPWSKVWGNTGGQAA